MKKLKHGLALLKSVLFCLLAFILLYCIAAITIPMISTNKNQKKGDICVYIRTNGVHTDIVCPMQNDIMDWSQEVSISHTKSNQHQYAFVAFGWGDKGFYLNTPTWADLKFSTAFNAAFWLSQSAMHVTYYNQIAPSNTCKAIWITPESYTLLCQYIRNSFQKDRNKKNIFISTNAVYGDNDAFYEAIRSYNLFYTCNTWANEALKHAQIKTAIWTVTDKGIFRHYP